MKVYGHRHFNLLWFPAILVAGSLCLPLAYLLIRTLEAGPGVWEQIVRPQTWKLILNTTVLVVSVTVAAVAVALPLAWLTTRTDLPFQRLWTVLATLPLVIPSYVGAYTFVGALGPKGMVQQMLEGPLGIQRLPDIYGFPGAFLVLTLLTYPYLFLNVREALQNIDPALEEVSQTLEHDRWSTFWRITFPQLRPALAAGGLLVALYTLSDFGAVSMLQYNTFTRAIYTQYQAAFNRSYAAALGLILVLLSIIILYAEMRVRSRAKYYRTDSGARRYPPRVALGAWRWPALLFCGGIVFFSLVIPVLTIAYWLVRGVAAGESLRLLLKPVWNSFYISAVAAVVTAVAALPVMLLSVRKPGKLSHALERLTYIGYGQPGVAIALALVFFGIKYARPLYQTMTLLVFAYMVQFLPQAGGAIRASLLRINPRIEEAARSLGRSSMEVMATITWPLMRSGFFGGMIIVFLSVMKELPITMILGPTGFQTLATVVWGAMEEGFYARAALPSLLLVLVSLLSVTGLLKRIDR
ncbi:ABC transporter permease [Calderihabitans maritimus]|uniref:Binding-protein-dependent transport system inner membrane protein n=1 Tax=Calderihabitans maritimus TaxID=1246530 RepID=A0A1Z5HNZ3_9FIRM|nr:iron ABC transporter permease [Calderihabitans maritimus]GAW91000.1 binding-protein-dependent transport system inner membrane protein [Calderihabitans maritimus]